MLDSFTGALAPGTLPRPLPLPPRLLGAITASRIPEEALAALPRPAPGARTWQRIRAAEAFDVWLIRWSFGSGVPMHDHAESAGALRVLRGELVEYELAIPGPEVVSRQLRPRTTLGLPIGHVHAVRNESTAEAVSLHAYSPPLVEMRYYDDPVGAVDRRIN